MHRQIPFDRVVIWMMLMMMLVDAHKSGSAAAEATAANIVAVRTLGPDASLEELSFYWNIYR